MTTEAERLEGFAHEVTSAAHSAVGLSPRFHLMTALEVEAARRTRLASQAARSEESPDTKRAAVQAALVALDALLGERIEETGAKPNLAALDELMEEEGPTEKRPSLRLIKNPWS